jgi:hypothetical protein
MKTVFVAILVECSTLDGTCAAGLRPLPLRARLVRVLATAAPPMPAAAPKPESYTNGAAINAAPAPAVPQPVAVQGQVPVGAVLPPALVYETVRRVVACGV